MYIYVITFGDLEKRLLLAVAKGVKENLGFETRISWVASQPRYQGEKLLEYLTTLNYPQLLRMLAIVKEDIGNSEGLLRDKVALLSIHGIPSYDERLFFDRVVREGVNLLMKSLTKPVSP